MSDLLQVLTAVDSRKNAQRIADAVVRQRLAACAQVIGPITSTYWWKGQLETAEEWLCLLKTREELYERLADAIRSLHPYEVPEILALPVTAALPEYATWVRDVTAP